jgi:hypothetical protein
MVLLFSLLSPSKFCVVDGIVEAWNAVCRAPSPEKPPSLGPSSSSPRSG